MKHAKLGRQQGGTAAVEMALVLLFLVQLMLGIVDFSRYLFAINSAAEATRLGARTAAVCSVNAPGVKNRMKFFLPPSTTDSNINVSYLSMGCASTETCVVSVSLTGVGLPSIAWFLPAVLPMPAFTTVLPRESLASTIDSSSNPACS
jgi:TadE-like protein